MRSLNDLSTDSLIRIVESNGGRFLITGDTVIIRPAAAAVGVADELRCHKVELLAALRNSMAQYPSAAQAPAATSAAPAAEGLRFDPFTSRMICKECWNRKHGSKKSPMCKIRDCHCGCKDAREVQRKEGAAYTAAQAERKALERKMLEAETNPLRSFNPDYHEPTIREVRNG